MRSWRLAKRWYVSANLAMANNADENVVTYIREAKTAKASNTADVVA